MSINRTKGIFNHSDIGKDKGGTGVKTENIELEETKKDLDYKDLLVGRICPLFWGDYDKPILINYNKFKNNFINNFGNDLERMKELTNYFYNTGDMDGGSEDNIGYVAYVRAKGSGGVSAKYKYQNSNNNIGTITAKYEGSFGNDLRIYIYQVTENNESFFNIRIVANNTINTPNSLVLIEEFNKLQIPPSSVKYYLDYINENSKFIKISNAPNTVSFSAEDTDELNNSCTALIVDDTNLGVNPTLDNSSYYNQVDVFTDLSDKDLVNLTVASKSDRNVLSSSDLLDIQNNIIEKIDKSTKIKTKSIIPLFNAPYSGNNISEYTNDSAGHVRYELGNFAYNYVTNRLKHNGELTISGQPITGEIDSALVFLGAYLNTIKKGGYKNAPNTQFGKLRAVELVDVFTAEDRGKIGDVGYIVLYLNNYNNIVVREMRSPYLINTEDDKAFLTYTTLIAKSTFDVRTRNALLDFILSPVDDLNLLRDKCIYTVKQANSNSLSNGDIKLQLDEEEGFVVSETAGKEGAYEVYIKYNVHKIIENIIITTEKGDF